MFEFNFSVPTWGLSSCMKLQPSGGMQPDCGAVSESTAVSSIANLSNQILRVRLKTCDFKNSTLWVLSVCPQV